MAETSEKDNENFDIEHEQILAVLYKPFPVTKEYFKVNFKTKLVEPLVPKIRERLDEAFGKGKWKVTSDPLKVKEKWNGEARETHVFAKLEVSGMPFSEYETYGICDWMTGSRFKIAESDALSRLSIHQLNLASLGTMYANGQITPEILEKNEKRTYKSLLAFPPVEFEIINPEITK